jgi:hypothetical protein
MHDLPHGDGGRSSLIHRDLATDFYIRVVEDLLNRKLSPPDRQLATRAYQSGETARSLVSRLTMRDGWPGSEND